MIFLGYNLIHTHNNGENKYFKVVSSAMYSFGVMPEYEFL